MLATTPPQEKNPMSASHKNQPSDVRTDMSQEEFAAILKKLNKKNRWLVKRRLEYLLRKQNKTPAQ